jgi:hypothetical protein
MVDAMNGVGGTFRTLHGRPVPLDDKIVDQIPVAASTAEGQTVPAWKSHHERIGLREWVYARCNNKLQRGEV